ncbi:uncharacterized protein BDZ99DRAFT_486282 [Mytilinidion resinicola]|uniref:Uncharacterized protein n=1 Tax=Mytilinidion resinicola TaxID=574789 RepID=A0A6A6Z2I0_9PEZI|nr:uncharacterized protein BDZ99DRAFT_486282 [Mytilinidion resinicola]KAF2814437.1 hypothetical protein BDZ99DRAFT_486282 [Mytilinidion resinicola]
MLPRPTSMLLDGDEGTESEFALVDLDAFFLAFDVFAACAPCAGDFYPRDPRIPPATQHKFKIPLPEDDLRQHMEAWLTALEPFLPTELRRAASEKDTKRPLAQAIDYARLITEAQSSSQDILSHMGTVEGRWNVVIWLIKCLVEEGSGLKRLRGDPETSDRAAWKDTSLSLKELTQFPIYAERIRKPQRLNQSLKELTSAPETIQYLSNIMTAALGQVWRSLGSMILVAAEEPVPNASTVMSHVLEIIAYLHHVEMIPQAIYRYAPARDPFTLQQPPTLHLLSSRILTSLSDATWRAHEASLQPGKTPVNSQYFMGHEIPGSRIKITVPQVGPEIWVELVLWSCLHGGWITDGVAILEKLSSYSDDKRWSVICWRDIVASSQSAESLQEPKNWERLAAAFEYPNRSYASDRGDRRLVQRTISSEVIAAFVDGLTNTMRLGVGARGNAPEDILRHIKNLKHLLDQNNLSLGTSSWDGIILRLLESHGIVPDKRPYVLLKILDLSQGFGKEISSANVALESSLDQLSPNYVFEGSAAPIGLLHRTLRAFIEAGQAVGATITLNKLQEYTDNNKMGSMIGFFQALKRQPSTPEHPFGSTFAPVDFPGFYPQIPVPLLAGLLDVLAKTHLSRICEWLLFSDDLDGPLIPPRMYRDRRITPSIIRYGTISKNKELLLKVVEAVAVPVPGKQGGLARLPAEVLSAFLNSQIEGRQWASVTSICQYAASSPGYRPRAETLAVFASKMLWDSVYASDATELETDNTVKTHFANLLHLWRQKIKDHLDAELNTILGIISTVHPDYSEFCESFWTAVGRQPTVIGTSEFNKILEGVAIGYGSIEAKRIVDLWCNVPPGPAYWPFRSPGGLPKMSKFRPPKSIEYHNRPRDIEMDRSASFRGLSFRGLVTPNIHTYRILLRRARHEKKRKQGKGTEMSPSEHMKLKEMLASVAFQRTRQSFVRPAVSIAPLSNAKQPRLPKAEGRIPSNRHVELGEAERICWAGRGGDLRVSGDFGDAARPDACKPKLTWSQPMNLP